MRAVPALLARLRREGLGRGGGGCQPGMSGTRSPMHRYLWETLAHPLGVLRSQTCIGQPFLIRSCRSELPAVCFSFCALHRPGVPQRLVVRPRVESQRYSGHGGIKAPTSGRCEEETGAVTASPCSRSLPNPTLLSDLLIAVKVSLLRCQTLLKTCQLG